LAQFETGRPAHLPAPSALAWRAVAD